MALLMNSSLIPMNKWEKSFLSIPLIPSSSSSSSSSCNNNNMNKSRRRRQSAITFKRIQAFFNPFEDPILKDALKEPVAFMGGVFAGLLRLDLKEDPLREWISKTAEASGIAQGEIDAEGVKTEAEDVDAPQQIEIE